MSKVDHLVLSHGHFDHTGGLPSFLKINKKAQIHIQPEAFAPKYHSKEYIGFPKMVLPKLRIVHSLKPLKISKHIYIIPFIKIKNKWDTNFNKLKVKQSAKLIIDTFKEEQFILIKKKNEIFVLTFGEHYKRKQRKNS